MLRVYALRLYRQTPPTTRVAWLLALAAFAWFAAYRVVHIGGCDSASYLAESFRLRGIDVGLAPDPRLPFPEAFTPICMAEHGGVVRSLFPPGFAVLLAAFGSIGLHFFVTPLFGALGGLALFHLARKHSTGAIALAVMIAWYAAPLTFWGSTQIMTDLVAASLVLLAILAVDRGRAFLGALVLGFAIGVRPMVLLALPAVAVFLYARPRREWAQAALGLAIAGGAWLLFLRLSFGTFELPYLTNASEMRGESFLGQLGFLCRETFRQYAPLVALAVVGVVAAPRTARRATVACVVWFVPFVVVHGLWRVPLVWWWQIRFLAPGLPGLFLAAAIGARALWDVAARRSARVGRVVSVAGGALTLAYAIAWIASSEAGGLRERDRDERYALDTIRVRELVPADAIIGAREHTITLRFYGRLQTFQWCHPDVPKLITAAHAQGRRTYALFMFDDDNGCRDESTAMRGTFDFEEVGVLPSNSRLVEVKTRR
jgi:hypothetical protein